MYEMLTLLVEDEAILQMELEEALGEAGYKCVCVVTGTQAIEQLSKNAVQFKGVLTDIRIGEGPTGWDVARHARELIHDMPIVYMSGDSALDWSSNGVPNSIMITKPYATAQIIIAISQLINNSSVVNFDS